MISHIGDIEVNLNVENWCEIFNIPSHNVEEEEKVRSLSKEELFSNISQKQVGLKQWINVGELPQDPTLRLAVSVLMNIIIPKRGSKEQIREDEARILYALKNRKALNIAKDIVDRIKKSFLRRNTPLCYPMHLMTIMRKAGVNPSIAGDGEPVQLKNASLIGAKTLIRLGFKKDLSKWDFVGRGSTKTKFMEESHTAARGGENEEEEEVRRPEGTEQATGIPSESTHVPIHQLTSQIADLSNQLAHNHSTLTERLDYFAATLNSRFDSMDSRLDDLHLRVRNCEIKLNSFQQTQPPPPSSTQPPPPSSTQPPPASSTQPPPTAETTSTAIAPYKPIPIKRAVSKTSSKDFSRRFQKKPKPSS